MSPLTILVVVLVIVVFAGLPGLGYHNMGWRPSGLLGVVLIIALIFLVLGRRF